MIEWLLRDTTTCVLLVILACAVILSVWANIIYYRDRKRDRKATEAALKEAGYV